MLDKLRGVRSTFFRQTAFAWVAPHAVEVKLHHRFVIGAKHVAYRPAANEVANLFRHVLGVISGALEFLRHRNHVKALLARFVVTRFQVPHQYQITQPIEFAVRTEYGHGTVKVALAECEINIGQHLL